MPRKTVEFDAVLRLKLRNAGQRNVECKAELFVNRRDKERIQDLILATGVDSVPIRDMRERS